MTAVVVGRKIVARSAVTKQERDRINQEKSRDEKYGTARPKQNTFTEVLTLSNLPEWHDQAVCKGKDPDLWFLDRGDSSAEAKAICAECPVEAECLDWALTRKEPRGIWGGTSERERRRIRQGLPVVVKRGRQVKPPRDTKRRYEHPLRDADRVVNWSQETPRETEAPPTYEPDTTARIIAAVAQSFAVADLCAHGRQQPTVLARQVAMWLTRTLTAASTVEVGRRFGGRDHSTVVHAEDVIGRLMASFPAFAARVNTLADTLR